MQLKFRKGSRLLGSDPRLLWLEIHSNRAARAKTKIYILSIKKYLFIGVFKKFSRSSP